jgi:hypothetical protein
MTSTASALGKKKRFIIVKRKAVEYEEAGTSSEGAGTGTSTSSEGASRLSEYIAQLTEQEIIVMKIAAEHLKTSFDLEKSSGYLQYLRKQ